MPKNFSTENNFDLLRLHAALQIMLFHYYYHVHFAAPALNGFVSATVPFSGIIILFTISGFLIFASFDNSPGLKNYFRNRFLRMYPCLWVCLLFTVIVLLSFGYVNPANIFSRPFVSWLAAQVSFLQFYTPDMLRSFGVGTPNGSLWTVPVEVSFYLFVPLFFWLARKTKLGRNVLLLFFMALSVAGNYYCQLYKTSHPHAIAAKLMNVTLVPYLFYFLLGALAYTNWRSIEKWYTNKGLFWVTAYLVYYLIFSVWLRKFSLSYHTNCYHFIAVVLLSQATISMAFTRQWLSIKLLRHNDISFGIYAYHMPVINSLLALGITGHDYIFFITLAIILLIAILSWKFIELPALSLKRKSINQLPE